MQELLSFKELQCKVARELSKYRVSLSSFNIIPSGQSASILDVWKPQFFYEQFITHYSACINKILAVNNRLSRNVVGARTLKVSTVSDDERCAFFDTNHVQGNGQGFCIGLYDNTGLLLSAMIVKRAPKNSSSAGYWELNRYASMPSIFVVGGFEKLLRAAESTLGIDKWISYADLMVSHGSLYQKQGWSLIGRSAPDYKCLYNGILYHKFNFRISRFISDERLLYKDGYTEKQLDALNRIVRVYDCGKLKFEKIEKS